MSKYQHPDWMAVGKTVRIVRTTLAGRVDVEYTSVVARHTPTTAVMDSGHKFTRIEGEYVERPAYLDYTTRAMPGEGTCLGCGANLEFEGTQTRWVDTLSVDDGGTYDQCPSAPAHTIDDRP